MRYQLNVNQEFVATVEIAPHVCGLDHAATVQALEAARFTVKAIPVERKSNRSKNYGI